MDLEVMGVWNGRETQCSALGISISISAYLYLVRQSQPLLFVSMWFGYY